MHKSIKVRILGREYPLRVQEEDEATMMKVARTVDSRMQSFKSQHPEQPDLVAAVIAALTLAEEMTTARETSSMVLKAMDREIRFMDQELTDAMS